MSDLPKRRLFLIAKIFFVSTSLTFLLTFLLPTMMSHAYVSEVVVDDTEAEFEDEPVELNRTTVVSGTTLDDQGVELQPLAAWTGWLTDTITDTNNTQPFPPTGEIVDAMAVAHEGKIYVVGGFDGANDIAEIYTATIIAAPSSISNAVTSWVTQTETLPAGEERSAGALVISQTGVATYSYLYLIAGYDNTNGDSLGSVFSATVNNDTGSVSGWTRVLTLTDPSDTQINRLHYHSAVLHEGTIYVIGGYCTANIFFDTCEAGFGDKYSQRAYTATIQADGSLTSPNATLGYWGIITEALPQPRALGAAVLYEGPVSTTIYYMGGTDDGATPYSTIYYSDILIGDGLTSWLTSTATMSQSLYAHGLVLAQGEMIQVGGYDNAGSRMPNVAGAVPYDRDDSTSRLYGFGSTATNPPFWFQGPQLPDGRALHATVAYGDRIFAIGGDDGSANGASNLVYHTTLTTTCSGTCTYPPEGIYVSRVFSTSDYVTSTISSLFWEASLPVSTGLAISYRYSTTSNLDGESWYTDTSSISGTNTLDFIPPIATPVYFQYRATLTSAAPYNNTPLLYRIGFLQEKENPDLAITKTTTVVQVIPGETYSYSISLVYTKTWTGPFTATVTETIPLSTTYVGSGWTAAGTAPDGRSMYTRQVSLPLSATNVLVPLSITVTTDSSLPGSVISLPLTNTVATGALPDVLNPVITDPTPANNIYTHTIVFTNVALPVLSISKDAAPPHGSTVNAGEQIVYTLTYTVGNAAATDLRITDTLVNTIYFSSIDPGSGYYDAGAGVITYSLGNVVTGTTASVYFTATVGTSAVTVTAYNTATIGSPLTGTTTSNLVTHTIAASITGGPPVLSIVKDSMTGSPVYIGSQIRYVLTYTVGNSGATGLRITDVVNTAIISDVDAPGGSYNPPTGQLTYGPWDVSVGTYSLYFTATVRTDVVSGSVLPNQATISALLTGTATSNTTNHTIIHPGGGQTTLEMSKVVDFNIVDQHIQDFHYYIYITNTGSAPAYDLVVTDTLPKELTGYPTVYAGYEPPGSPTYPSPPVWFGAYFGDYVRWETAKVPQNYVLEPGGASRLSVEISTTIPITDQWVLTNSNYIATGSNVTGVITGGPVPITINAPEWTITKTGPSDVIAGDPISYTIRVTNTGHLTVFYSYIVTDLLPGFIAGTVGCNPACAQGSGLVTWTFATLPYVPLDVGDGLTTSLYVTATAPITNNWVITNTCVVSGYDVIPSGICNPVTTTIHSWPVLTITKQGLPEPVDAGELLTYTTIVTNEAGANGIAVRPFVTDVVPNDTIFITATGGLTITPIPPPISGSGTITWELPSLWPGQSAMVTMTVRVTSPLPDGTVITNYVTVTDTDALTPATAIATNTVRSSPDITLTKTVTPNLVLPGETVTYTIVLTNQGNATADNALVTDTLPFSFGAMIEGPNPLTYALPNATNLTWTLTITGRPLDAPTGPPITLSFTATASSIPGVYSNTVTATAGISNSIIGPTAPVTVALPDLVITKVAPITVPAGSLLTYTIIYTNNGLVPAHGSVITDQTPPYTVFFTATGATTTPPLSGTGVVTWDLGTVWPGNSGVVTMVVTVTSPLTNGTIITNFVWMTSTHGVSATAMATTTVVAEPLLVAFKEATPPSGSPVQPGSTITYTVTVTNFGNGNALNLVITDPLPNYANYISGTASGSPGGSWNNADPLTYTIASLLGGGNSITFTFQATVTTPLTNGTIITNNAYVSATNTPAITYSNPVTHVVVSTPTLVASKAADPPHGSIVHPGDTITYTVTVTNTGSDVAANVVITDNIPASTNYVAGSASGSPGGSWGNADPLTYTIASLPGGGGVLTFTFRVTVETPLTNGLVISNSADVYGEQLYGTWSDITTTNQVTHLVESSVAFSVTKTADPPHGSDVAPGDTITYTVILTNNGDSYAVNPTITDSLPVNTNYVLGSLDGTPGYIWTVSPNPLAMGWPSLAGSGGVLTFTFQVTVTTPLTNGTIISNYAQAGTPGLPISYTNEVTHRVVSTPNLQILKMADPPHGSNVTPGSAITYTIIVTNVGDGNALNLVITDPLPSYTNYVNNSASGSPGGSWNDADPLTYTTASLPGGGSSITFTFQVTVNLVISDGTIITNVAQVVADSLAITPTNEVTHRVSSIDEITATKTAQPPSGSTVQPGDTIVYTVNVTNSGTTLLTNLLITDSIPLNTNYVAGSADGSPGGSWGQNDPLTYTIPSLAAGNSITFTFSVTVEALTPGGTIIANTAWITTDQTGITYTNQVTHVVVSTATLQLSKEADPPHGSTVNPGDTITYTLTISNVGTAIANNVRITDTLDPNVNLVGTPSPLPILWPNPLVWQLASLSPLSPPVTFTFQVQVTTPLTDGTIINNVAQASADNVVITTSNSITHRVASAVTLQVSKEASPPHGSDVLPGSTINYTIRMMASGDGYATNMTITDLLDSNVGLVGVPTPPQSSGPNPLVWDGSRSLAAGSNLAISFDVTVTLGITQTTLISNSADIFSAQTLLTNTNVVTHLIIPISPVLTITKSANPPQGSTVMPGGSVTYNVRVTNIGNYTATGLLFSDTVPANTNYVSSSSSPVYPIYGPDLLTMTVPELGPGNFVDFTFNVTVSTSFTDGVISNVAWVSSTLQLVSSEVITHRVQEAGGIYLPVILKNFAGLPADLEPISFNVVPASPNAGVPASITVVVRNNGPGDATGFWVDMYINPSATPTVNKRWNDLNSTEGIAWSVPGLAAGSTVTLVSTCSSGATYPPPPCFGTLYSLWPGYFVSGKPRTLYVLVDSWGPNPWGGVQETNEANNLSGPLIMTSLGGEAEEEGIAPPPQQQEIAPRPLP